MKSVCRALLIAGGPCISYQFVHFQFTLSYISGPTILKEITESKGEMSAVKKTVSRQAAENACRITDEMKAAE